MPARDLTAGLRFAVSTLTVARLPTGRVDRDAARVGMLFAPWVGLALGALTAAVAYGARLLWPSALLPAVVTIATLAAASGLLHLDGLADTADGFGAPAGRDRLEIMRTPTIGAFGVVVVVLVLLTQIAALALCVEGGLATIAIVAAVTTSRLTITLGCVRGVRAARIDGLGAVVAETIGYTAAALTTLAVTGALLALTVVHDDDWSNVGRVVWSTTAGLLAGLVCQRVAVRRLGGITGDVLGAGVELAMVVTLLALCIRA